MKTSLRLLIVMSALVVAAMASSAAVSVVGMWKGSIVVDASKLPAVTDPNQRKMMEAGLAQVKKVKGTLNLRADKTYTATFTGGPAGAPKVNTGKWSQSGNTVTITPLKNDGKAISGPQAQPQKLTVSANGKTMTMTPPGQAGMGVKVIFKR